MKEKKQNNQETFSTQLVDLWERSSKSHLTLVLLLSILSAIALFFLKLYFEGVVINSENFYLLLKWDNCIIHFTLLSFFIWFLLLYKKIFSSKNNINRASRFQLAFDRVISQSHSIQFYWLVCCCFLLFLFLSSLMGTIDAFGVFPRNNALDWNPLSLTYILLTDTSTIATVLKTQSHVVFILAAICIVASLLGTLLFTGLLVSVFSNFLQRRVESYEKGRIHYELSDHIVFIGYDDILLPLVKQCAEFESNRNRKIVVQTKKPSEEVREDIKPLITNDSLFRNIIFYNGRRNSVKDLMNLDLQRASEIFIVGDRNSENHDEINLQCYGIIQDIINKKKDEIKSNKSISLHILIEDHTEYSKMKFFWNKEEILQVSLFNIYAIWAKTLIKGNNEFPQIINTGKKGVNIIIFGMSKYGFSIEIEAIYTFLRDNHKNVITIICNNAFDEMLEFRAKFSYLSDLIKWEYNNMKDTPIIYDNTKRGKYFDKSELKIEFYEANPFNDQLVSCLHNTDYSMMDRYIFCCTQDNTKDINIALFYSQKQLIPHIYIHQKHGAQFINKLAYGNFFHVFGNFRSSINIYQYLHNIPNDSYEKYDSYLETSNIYLCQGNFLQAYHYRKIALEIRNYLFKDKVDPIEFLGYYSFEKAQRFIDEGWSLYSSYTGEYTDWSIVEAVELFSRAIDILEKLYGDKPQSMEVLETLASAYEGSYIAEEISKITDWRNDYNKYLELNRLIEEKKNNE